MRRVFIIAALIGLAACAGPNAQTAKPSASDPNKPKITDAQMLGKSDAWLLQNLGEPHFKRTERTANIWQYKNDACVLNVFLYADAPAGRPVRVLHFDARDATGKNTDRKLCLSALQD